MKLATLVHPAMTGLTLSLALLCAGCRDEERVDVILGTGLQVVSAPNPVHTAIDPTGTSVITVTVSDAVNLTQELLGNEPVELETMDGTLVPTMGLTEGDPMDPDFGMFTSMFSNSSPVLATVAVRANDLEVFHLIEVTDREPAASDPSTSFFFDPVSVTVTDCAQNVSVGGQLFDSAGSIMQGATINLAIKTGSAMPVTLTGIFTESGTTTHTVTSGGLGIYPNLGTAPPDPPPPAESATFVLDLAECAASCAGMGPTACEIRLMATFTTDITAGATTYNSNDVVITTDIP